jgi:hypothetical protein
VATERQIKANAGYVQVEGFADAGPGYCCGTCRALSYEGDMVVGGKVYTSKDGFCTGLQVPVRTYGCCNNWKLASKDKVRGYDGRRLRVIR